MSELALMLLFAIPIVFFALYPAILRYEKGRLDRYMDDLLKKNKTHDRREENTGDLFKKWYVGRRPNDLYAKYDLYTTVQNDHGVLIEVRGDLGDFDRQRVAYFIAAAPKMFEALKLAQSFMLGVEYNDLKPGEPTETYNVICEAISDAKGGRS